MNIKKQVTIVTIPLVYYHEQIYWGLYTEHTGKIRNHILCHPTAGKQVPFAFAQWLSSEDAILIAVDDKFNFERSKDEDNVPLDAEVSDFLRTTPLPHSWLERIVRLGDIAVPPNEFACGEREYAFSEKKLFHHARHQHGLPGECANEWTHLLAYLEKAGYEKITAYIPKVCAKGICYATPYAQESGIWKNPITIGFTDNTGVVFEYPTKEPVSQ